MNYIRSTEVIQDSYVARFEPRATGRTTKMILSLPRVDQIHDKIYIVALSYIGAQSIIRRIAELRGYELAKRCVPVGSNRAFVLLQLVNPLDVYIDHTALEYSKLEDIKYLY